MRYLLVIGNQYTLTKDVFLIDEEGFPQNEPIKICAVEDIAEVLTPAMTFSINTVKVKGNRAMSRELRDRLIYSYQNLTVEDID